MRLNYHKQQNDFVQFLRHGIYDLIIPGGFTYDQIVDKFGLPKSIERPQRGVTCTWFQDLFFWFDDNALLATIGVRLKPTTEDVRNLPKALNFEWIDFASQLIPETFEELVINEQIPCLKATKISDEEIYPPIYCLDHLGLMPRFEYENPYTLYGIDFSLIRTFPRLHYTTVWPTYNSEYLLDLPVMISDPSL